MIHAITIIAFLLLVSNIPFTIAVNIGLKLKEKDPTCKDEIKDVKGNERAIKIFQTVNTVMWLIMLILIICLK